LRKKISKSEYEHYGLYYDQIFSLFPKSWRRARMRLVRHTFPDLQSVCELGCGTGTGAIEFARQGLRVFAVDLSPTMLRMARQKIHRARVPILLIHADMRSFRLPQAVDLVSAEWGVVNHVPRAADLVLVARAVARALRPGGYFVFDVNHRSVFDSPASPYIQESSNFFLLWDVGWDPRSRKGWRKMTWFMPQRAGWWKRYDEKVEQVIWSLAEIRRTLRRGGFDRIRTLDYGVLTSGAGRFRKPKGYKTLVLARKKPL
jgi:SAM-dependent methyltransferase